MNLHFDKALFVNVSVFSSDMLPEFVKPPEGLIDGNALTCSTTEYTLVPHCRVKVMLIFNVTFKFVPPSELPRALTSGNTTSQMFVFAMRLTCSVLRSSFSCSQ